MELLLTKILEQPLSALSFAFVVVIIIFQMAQMGIIDIRIGKQSKKNIKVGIDHHRQIDVINQDVEELKKDVKNIKENHLAHIQEDMARIREDVSFIKGKLSKN